MLCDAIVSAMTLLRKLYKETWPWILFFRQLQRS
jgi:hypothetical protein